tara:strand:+ start:25489 stop:25710 length:222 start_codon:yes stop_codon:yes gene_type:complete
VDRIFPTFGSEEAANDPEILKQILAKLVDESGGEIRIKDLKHRALLSVYFDQKTLETVVRVQDVPWSFDEDGD